VAGLFADPPDWLSKRVEMYHRDPRPRFARLCAAVAAAVLSHPTRAEEVGETSESWVKVS